MRRRWIVSSRWRPPTTRRVRPRGRSRVIHRASPTAWRAMAAPRTCRGRWREQRAGVLQALGVELAEWGQREVSVSCFADPEVHARQDRDASCSVNVESGLWNCHGCGEGGGLCDAATELGNTPREAMDLLIAYGLAERRPAGQAQQPRRPTASARPAARPVSRPAEQVALKVGESDVARWREQLVGVWPPRVLRAAQRSVWSRTVPLELGCGWERGRIMIPGACL